MNPTSTRLCKLPSMSPNLVQSYQMVLMVPFLFILMESSFVAQVNGITSVKDEVISWTLACKIFN